MSTGISGSIDSLAVLRRFACCLSLDAVLEVLARFVPRVLLDSEAPSSYSPPLSAGEEAFSAILRALIVCRVETIGADNAVVVGEVEKKTGLSSQGQSNRSNEHHVQFQTGNVTRGTVYLDSASPLVEFANYNQAPSRRRSNGQQAIAAATK